jgi:DNA-binding transcriptional MerR regulator
MTHGSTNHFASRTPGSTSPSAIRYYERIGLLPPAERLSGQRRYDSTVLYRLAIIHRAGELGFTLSEIRNLFFGFPAISLALRNAGERSPKANLPSWIT